MALTGNQCSITAKMTMRMTPLTNSGMTVMDIDEMVMTRSSALSRRNPANTPTRIEVGTMMTSAKPASSSELPRACMASGNTAVWYCSDWPQWPVTKWPAHSR